MPRDPTNAILQALDAVLSDAVQLYAPSAGDPVEYVPFYGADVPDNPELPYIRPGEIDFTPTPNGREGTAQIDAWTERRSEAERLKSRVVELTAADFQGEPVPLPNRDGFAFTQSVAEFTTTIDEPDPKGGAPAFHAVVRLRVRAQQIV